MNWNGATWGRFGPAFGGKSVMKIVYFGDGAWGTRCLEQLLADEHEVLAVVLRVNPSESSLADTATRHGLAVRAPLSANASEFVEWVRSLGPELNISMSYDQIVKQPLLGTAPLGFLNCHAGRLPFYRGRSVINWAILNDEKEIGLTIHFLDEGIDTGDIVSQRTLPILWEDDYASVLAKVNDAFPAMLAETVRGLADGSLRRTAQRQHLGTYFCRRLPGDEWIDWRDSSRQVYNKIRAITRPGPGARTELKGRGVAAWKARYNPDWPRYLATPGEVVSVEEGGGIRVKTGDSTVVLVEIEFIGPEPAPRIRIGSRFGANLPSAVARLEAEVANLKTQVRVLSDRAACHE